MSAWFSPDRVYRYLLERDVDPLLGHGRVTFVGLNPSTADERKDDPTIRRCFGFARSWGYARLGMLNLYGYRSTDPRLLLDVADPVGPDNDEWLHYVSHRSELVVAAWGVNAPPDRVARAVELLPNSLACLGTTKDGHPRHPLYVPGSTRPRPWEHLTQPPTSAILLAESKERQGPHTQPERKPRMEI